MVLPGMGLPLADVNCTYCGQCSVVCPVVQSQKQTLPQKYGMHWLIRKYTLQFKLLRQSVLHWGEEFDLAPGTLVTGKLVSALKLLGFDSVFDTNFTADLTIMEEGTEFLGRVKAALTGGEAVLPDDYKL